jgi:uncharacterized tellurite resistance protein B-like protein
LPASNRLLWQTPVFGVAIHWQTASLVAASNGPGRTGVPMDGSQPVRNLKAWISRNFGGAAAEDGAVREQARNLAVAALLVEVLRADYDVSSRERRQVLESIRGVLGLDEAQCEELLAEAEQQVDRAHDLHQFTSEVNRAFAHDEKLRLVEQLWRVAHADEIVHKYEEHLIRRIADLLHVSHRDFIAAKLRASGA